MDATAERAYAAFQEKVRRTVYIDNLSTQVNEPILRNAIDQFGTVRSIEFIPNYIEPLNIPRCALVEMEDANQAEALINLATEYPLMISGMPRPVRARAAEAEMFADRPAEPGRRIAVHWLEPDDPDFQVAQKLKDLVNKHAAEASFLLKKQLAEEQKLAKLQEDSLKTNHQKYKVIDGVMADGTAERLANRYGLNLRDNSYY